MKRASQAPSTESRAEAKAETRRRIILVARDHVARYGAGQLSMRKIARDVGVVPSALYKHVPTRDALLTELITDSYASLADHLSQTGETWESRALALRDWALSRPHEFQLLYGTPVVDYRAPEETVTLAARVFEQFAAVTPPAHREIPEALEAQVEPLARPLGLSPGEAASTLGFLSQLVGSILLELGGHFVGTVSPADVYYRWLVATQT